MAFTGIDWGRRVLLTGLTPGSSLSGYVALITLDNIPTEMVDAGSESALNGGGDIRVSTDSAGTNQLPIHIVDFVTNATEGSRACIMWVRFPTYSSGNRECYLFYGKAGETQPATGAAFGRDAVYTDERATWSLNNGDASQDNLTGNTDYNLTESGSVLDNTSVKVFGEGSSDLNQTGHYVIANDPFAGVSTFTWRGWVQIEPAAAWQGIISSWTSDTNMSFMGFVGAATFSSYWFRLRNTSGTTTQITSTTIRGSTSFKHVTLSYDGSNLRLYVDKVLENTVAHTGTVATSTVATEIGRYDLTDTRRLNGSVQRFGVTTNVLNADFIETEYDNQVNASTFWTTGTPENTVSTIDVSPNVSTLDIDDLNPSVSFELEVSPNVSTIDIQDLNPSIFFELDVSPNISTIDIQDLNPIIDFSTTVEVSPNVSTLDIQDLNPTILIESTLEVSPNVSTIEIQDLNPTIVISTAGDLRIIYLFEFDGDITSFDFTGDI